MMQKSPRIVQCPTCNSDVEWVPENKHRPFCSKRCKLIDFGEWASEKHSIPGEPVFPPEDDPEQLQ